MGRNFAGILGLLAFMVVIARAVIHGTSPGDALMTAWLAMLGFTVIGLVIGSVAAWIVDDALRSKLLMELATREAGGPQAAEKPA